MKYFSLVCAGLWRKKVRMILTMLSIVFDFLLFGLVQGVNTVINQAVERLDVYRFHVTPRISQAEHLPLAYHEQLKTIPGVTAVSLTASPRSYYQNSCNPIHDFATDAPPLL